MVDPTTANTIEGQPTLVDALTRISAMSNVPPQLRDAYAKHLLDVAARIAKSFRFRTRQDAEDLVQQCVVNLYFREPIRLAIPSEAGAWGFLRAMFLNLYLSSRRPRHAQDHEEIETADVSAQTDVEEASNAQWAGELLAQARLALRSTVLPRAVDSLRQKPARLDFVLRFEQLEAIRSKTLSFVQLIDDECSGDPNGTHAAAAMAKRRDAAAVRLSARFRRVREGLSAVCARMAIDGEIDDVTHRALVHAIEELRPVKNRGPMIDKAEKLSSQSAAERPSENEREKAGGRDMGDSSHE